MMRSLYIESGATAERIVSALYPPHWAQLVIVAYTLVVLALALRVAARPGRLGMAMVLPHLAPVPLLAALAFSFIALVGDLTGAPSASQGGYRGMGVVWPTGLSRIVQLVPVGLVCYIVLLIATLIAMRKAREITQGHA